MDKCQWRGRRGQCRKPGHCQQCQDFVAAAALQEGRWRSSAFGAAHTCYKMTGHADHENLKLQLSQIVAGQSSTPASFEEAV